MEIQISIYKEGENRIILEEVEDKPLTYDYINRLWAYYDLTGAFDNCVSAYIDVQYKETYYSGVSAYRNITTEEIGWEARNPYISIDHRQLYKINQRLTGN